MEKTRRGAPSLLEKDFCKHGHDIRDKEKSVLILQTGNNKSYYCRECFEKSRKRYKTNKSVGLTGNTSFKGKLLKEIIGILDEFDEVTLMKILVNFKEGSGK
jgi:hypothetical protein